MRCKIMRVSDDYVLNVRHTDEIGEEYGMADSEIDAMEERLKKYGRYYLNSETMVLPVRC